MSEEPHKCPTHGCEVLPKTGLPPEQEDSCPCSMCLESGVFDEEYEGTTFWVCDACTIGFRSSAATYSQSVYQIGDDDDLNILPQ